MSSLLKRSLSTIVLVSFFALSAVVDWFFGIVVMIFVALGLYEYFTMLENKKIEIYKYFGITIGVIIPLSVLSRFELTRNWELLLFVCSLICLFMMQFKRRQNSGATVGIATTLFGLMYVAWPLSFAIKIRYMENGIGYLAAVLSMTKSADIGAYLFGSWFGKTPLIPRISPNKTVEGTLGGLITSALVGLAFRPLIGLPAWQMALMGFLIGLVGQLGDLSESLMKRDCLVKDSSNIIPGIGGVLDLVDSLLFAIPVFYFILVAYLHKVL